MCGGFVSLTIGAELNWQFFAFSAGADTTDDCRFEKILGADEGPQIDFGFEDTPKKGRQTNKK